MVDSLSLVAVFVALAAALANACQSILIRIGTEDGEASHSVFVVILVNVFVLVPLVSAIYYPEYGLTRVSWLSFAAAGLLGTLLGRAFMYSSIQRIGASRTAPIVASQALIATVFGVVFLGESLTAAHGVGVVLIVIGVAVIAWETSNGRAKTESRRELLVGLLLPLGAAFAYAGEPIFANYGFAEGTPAPAGLAVKTVAASLGFTLYLGWHDALPDRAVLWSRNTRWFVYAGLANTLFLLGYYLALEIAPVNVVVPIYMTNTLFVVVLSAVFMPRRLERVTARIAAAATVVVVGVLVVTVSG